MLCSLIKANSSYPQTCEKRILFMNKAPNLTIYAKTKSKLSKSKATTHTSTILKLCKNLVKFIQSLLDLNVLLSDL
jgi:hypothetical protein